MSSHNSSSLQSSDRRLLVIVVAIIVALTIGFYFLFDWAYEHFPWTVRVVIVLLAVFVGYRVGLVIRKRAKDATGLNWTAIGVAAGGLLLAGWLGMIRPAMHDRERDREFAQLLADGQALVEKLHAVERQTPESTKERVGVEFWVWAVDALDRTLDWMKRCLDEKYQYTKDQERQLQEQYDRVAAAAKAANAKLERLRKAKE